MTVFITELVFTQEICTAGLVPLLARAANDAIAMGRGQGLGG